ncbi:MAG: hypothetical protein WBN51_06885 [Gammaproteobacteria bacterium]
MIIYIGNLTAVTTERDLRLLAGLPATAPVRIIKKPAGVAEMSRYGLVHTRSDREGSKLIGQLQGKICNGNVVSVREFGHRLAGNERRRLDWRTLPWEGRERRTQERRAHASLTSAWRARA